MKQAMRTFLGMMPRTMEMSMLDSTRTKMTAAPMPSPLLAELVTAKVGQRPSTSRKGGRSMTNRR